MSGISARLLLALLIVFVAGCQPVNLEQSHDVQRSPIYAASPQVATIPVTVLPAFNSPVPTPSVFSGSVVGRAFIRWRDIQPVSNTVIYLGKVYWNQTKTEGIFALDYNIAPKTFTEHDGRFRFTNVEAGEYIIMFGDQSQRQSVYRDADGKAIVLKVEGGVTTDVGDIYLDY